MSHRIPHQVRTALACIALSVIGPGCSTPAGIPAWQMAYFTLTMAPQFAWCKVTGCPPQLPEGMTRSAFTPEPYARTAVALDVTPDGRVYVAETERQQAGIGDNRFQPWWLEDDLASRTVADRRAYIEKWAETEVGLPLSWFTEKAGRVEVYDDLDGDGVADESHTLSTFDDAVSGIAAGVFVNDGDVYLTNIPNLWLLRDDDGDGRADLREPLHEGFGVKTSLAGHDLHALVRGPDGRLYFTVGDRGYHVTNHEGELLEPAMTPGRGAAFRMNLDGSGLEVFATGLRNPQGIAFDDFGNLVTVDNNGDGGDEARVVYIAEGGETGWMMPYQTLADPYLRGPWNAERLWHLQHETQPAWILPPLAHLTRGPSGMAYYPGLGLPERYEGHFFVCDYRYLATQSGIRAFSLEPEGAGFSVVDAGDFVDRMLATDLDFGSDGRIYITEFDQFGAGTSQIHVVEHAESRADPRVAEAARLLREGMSDRESSELSALLGFADQRVRLEAQYELAARGEAGVLGGVARNRALPQLARIHALWGVAQIARERPGAVTDAGIAPLGDWEDDDDEVRAQLVKLVGESGTSSLASEVPSFLEDESSRTRYFAAITLGKLRSVEAIPGLVELLRENADRDVFLRHGAVYGLALMNDVDAVFARADDPSPSVRMGVLLVLRRAEDPRIAHFLSDSEPGLVVEATRAIYDLPIEGALPDLAALAGGPLPFRDDEDAADDPQTNQALQRRIVAANLRLGTQSAALALGAHAADTANPRAMRELALEALTQFAEPPPRELVYGMWRPEPTRDPAVVHAAIDRWIPQLLDGPLESEALAVALAYDRVPLDDDELAQRVADAGQPEAIRTASLIALSRRGDAAAGPRARAIDTALASDEPALRAEARDILAAVDPARALAAVDAIPADAPLSERQRGLATLGRIPGPAADERVLAQLERLRRGEVEDGLILDSVESARTRPSPAVAAALAEYDAEVAASGDLLTTYRFALDGGAPERGRTVYETRGDCQRCHGGQAGHGGDVGPSLAGVAEREGRAYLLESVMDPSAKIATGYESVTVTRRDGGVVAGTLVSADDGGVVLDVAGEPIALRAEEIAARSESSSAMPPMGLALSATDLRDLIAYLATL